MISEKILEPMAERRYTAANTTWITALQDPKDTLASNTRVMDKLHKQAEALGNPTSQREREQLVAVGERLIKALDQEEMQKAPDGRTTVTCMDSSGATHSVASSVYTIRAISWYLMARAAKEDVSQEGAGQGKKAGVDFPSAMVVEGSIRFKDPDNRLFNFLRSAPTVGPRAATHYEEMLDDPGSHRIAGVVERKQHWGLDDYSSKLPGKGGALVFNKLKPSGNITVPEIYLKIERVGCPAYNRFEKHLGTLDKGFRFVAAGDRNIEHVTHFLSSRGHADSADPSVQVQRHEHMHKGYLKKLVHTPFMNLMKEAGTSPEALKALKKEIKQGGGFAAVERELSALSRSLENTEKSLESVPARAAALLEHVREVRRSLDGIADGEIPVARGAEWRSAIFTVDSTVLPAARSAPPAAPEVTGDPPPTPIHTAPALPPATPELTDDAEWQLARKIAEDHGA
jgi:hypothetical protein